MLEKDINAIIEKIAREKRIENIIANVAKSEQQFDLDDLTQDLYLDLYTKDAAMLAKMIADDEIDYYLYRMVANNVYSVNSRYYRQYKNPRKIEDITNVQNN